ncbi:MAG: ribose-5-phosphate isomerase RpiA [Acidimicrobiia bacterium]
MAESGPQIAEKQAAGRHAARYVEDGMRVGLGTGSTVHWTTVALGERKADIVCVGTSVATEQLARAAGLRVVAPTDQPELDLAIDGADEIDARLNLVKGGGGAHTREKIVASMAARFIVVVDESKVVDQLGRFGLPLELLEFGVPYVTRRLTALGAKSCKARGKQSDNGNPLYDADLFPITDPAALAVELQAIPGIVEHGIFPAAMVERVVVAGATGVRELTAPR